MAGLFASFTGGGTASPVPPPPPAPPPTPPLLLPELIFEEAVLPFVEAARQAADRGPDRFSLLEHGSWSGLYGLELSRRFTRSTLVALEPNRTIWAQHATLARAQRRSNLVVAHTPISPGRGGT